MPTGNVASGQTLYGTYCAGCHTPTVANNVMNVTKATTASALDAAIAKVGSMSYLGTTLTMQNKLDIAAYINSAK